MAQTVGHRYGLGIHFGLCHGPVDVVSRLDVEDRTAWSGSVTTNETVAVLAPNLFGGDEKEGGVIGNLDICMGGDAQLPNDYLEAKIGAGIVPAYRGILGAVWRGGLVTSNNPYIKPWRFRVKRILQGWSGGTAWYAAKAAVGAIGDMNPAHIVYQCITDRRWGMGYPASSIDEPSFMLAADQLESESFGLSFKWAREETIQTFVQMVVDHFAGILGQRNTDGKFVLKLIRADYDPELLPTYGPSEIVDLTNISRPLWGETVNSVTVVYTDPDTSKDTPVTVDDLGNVFNQAAIVTRTQHYPGIRDRVLAIRVAQRDLNATTLPLARVSLIATRKMQGLSPGDVFKLTWPKEGIESVVYRVIGMDRGTLQNGEMNIEAVEDIYGMPASSYVAPVPVGWTDPRSAPAIATNRMAEEASRYELTQNLSPADLAALPVDVGYAASVAVRPSGDSIDFGMWTQTGANAYAEVSRGAFCPSALLTAAITPSQTSFTVGSQVDTSAVVLGTFAVIDNEVIRIDTFDTTTGAITCGRGVTDTVAAAHALGARVYFRDDYQAFDPAQRVDAEVWTVKLTPRTGRGQLDLGIAPADSITFDQRHYRPYPPGKFRLNTEAYPVVAAAPLVVDWAHRDRLLQNLESEEAADIGPEAGTTYNVRIYDADSALLLDSSSGISLTTYTSSVSGPQPLRVELESERGGLISRQKHDWGTIAFDGFVPGDRRISETGDRRISEAGDVRVIE